VSSAIRRENIFVLPNRTATTAAAAFQLQKLLGCWIRSSPTDASVVSNGGAEKTQGLRLDCDGFRETRTEARLLSSIVHHERVVRRRHHRC